MSHFHRHLSRGRRALHDRMGVPALYFALPYVDGVSAVRSISVRVHDQFTQLGDLKGTNFNYAEIEDNSPRIVFWRTFIEPQRNFIVSLDVDHIYRIDTVLPPDGDTITARVALMFKSETAGLPVPQP